MPTWNPKYAVGHPVIDGQHQQLFQHADELLEAMQRGRGGEELGELFQFLRTYVVEHFGTEERLMEAARYPAVAPHKAQHAEFVRRFTEGEEQYRAKGGISRVVLDVQDLVRGWLVTHVCTIDMQLARYLRRPE